jgi:hypothetical protein
MESRIGHVVCKSHVRTDYYEYAAFTILRHSLRTWHLFFSYVAAAKVVIFATCDECDGNDPRWMSSEAGRASTNFAFSTAVALSVSGRERKMNFVGILLAFAGRSMLVSGTSLWFLPETVFTIKSPI